MSALFQPSALFATSGPGLAEHWVKRVFLEGSAKPIDREMILAGYEKLRADPPPRYIEHLLIDTGPTDEERRRMMFGTWEDSK